jgi:poly-gamma-glutamate capsule biosynthesis protein CapA/YwtB (metallophosphatase superfamily)
MRPVLIGFVGDVLINRDDPTEVFADVQEALRVPDILFANLEGAYADDPQPAPGAFAGCSGPAHNLDAYAEAGFTVMSMANNHILDVGYEAMLENRSRLRARSVRTCGAGDCLRDAREPAIVESGGLRIAFLAYASVFPMGYEARSDTPGLVPMRAYNSWREPIPGTHLPGTPPLATTVPDLSDLARLTEDIRRARHSADLVVTSFHWGDSTRPFHLTDHEKRTARYCIDHGADLVVGHHHHALRGMEWYEGKPIMYGLGHFVFDLRLQWTDEFAQELSDLLEGSDLGRDSYITAPRDGWPFLPMHEDTRMTVMAWATADQRGVGDIGFLPCHITADGFVHPAVPGTADGEAVISYLQKCNDTQRLNGAITTDGSISISGFPTLRIIPRS